MEVNEKMYKLMLRCAFRYSLGRMSSIVTTVQDEILDKIHLFKRFELEQFIEEIEFEDNLGMSCDVQSWNNFVEKLKEEL